MTKNLELLKHIGRYLGKVNWKLAKETSAAELKLFQRVPIDIDKSYFVFGDSKILLKFKTFYLTRCVKKRPRYMQCSIDEYASELWSSSNDDFGLNLDEELIFLYRHENALTVGKSEKWLIETILNKITDRNRNGLVTIILSEIRIPDLEKSGELEFVNLSEKAMNQVASDIFKSSKIESNTGKASAGNKYICME